MSELFSNINGTNNVIVIVITAVFVIALTILVGRLAFSDKNISKKQASIHRGYTNIAITVVTAMSSAAKLTIFPAGAYYHRLYESMALSTKVNIMIIIVLVCAGWAWLVYLISSVIAALIWKEADRQRQKVDDHKRHYEVLIRAYRDIDRPEAEANSPKRTEAPETMTTETSRHKAQDSPAKPTQGTSTQKP